MSTCDMSGFAEPINLAQWTGSWAWFCRADCFLTAGGEHWSLPGWLSQKGFEFTWNRFGLGAEEGGLFILKSSPYSREQAEAKCSSYHSTLARSLSSDTVGPPQTPNIPDCSNFGLTAGGFHQGSWVGHYWLGMDVLQKLRGSGDWSPCPQAIQSLSNHVLLITVPYVMMSGMWIIAPHNANLIFRVISLQRKPWCSVKVWIRGQEMRY